MTRTRTYDLGTEHTSPTTGDYMLIDRNGWSAARKMDVMTITAAAGQAVNHGNSYEPTLEQAVRNAGAGRYNVLNYGASPAASAAVNAAAFQAAIAALPDYGVLQIPAGNYSLNDVLLFDTLHNIIIEGNGATLTFANGTTGDFVTFDTCNNVTLKDLVIYHDEHNNGGDGIYFDSCYNIQLVRCEVAGAQEHQVSLYNTWTVTTYDCSFTATGADAGYTAWHEETQANQIKHLRSYFKGGAGIAACHHVSGDALMFDNCTFESDHSATGDGLVIEEAHGVNIIGCYSESCGGRTYHIGSGTAISASVNIQGCYISLGDQDNVIGIELGNVVGVTIDGCYFLDSHSNSGTIGIKLGSTAAYPKQVTIGSGNFCNSVDTDVSDIGNRATDLRNVRTLYAGPNATKSAPDITKGAYITKGTICVNTNVGGGEPGSWTCVTSGYAAKENWTSGHTYVAGEWVENSSRIYVCKTAGGGAAANAPTHISGDQTYADGYTWTHIALSGKAAWYYTTGQLYTRYGSGTPQGSVTSYALHELYLDTNAFDTYIAQQPNNNGTWKKITP